MTLQKKVKTEIAWLPSIDSTNEEIKRKAAEGAAEGLVIAADMQTAGKGRRGRAWQSPAGKNLYFSILLRPEVKPDKASMVTLLMAVAVQKAAAAVSSTETQIKWPNDVIMHGKKITGILTEMYLKGEEIDFVVIGTGVNVKAQTFPEELVNASDIETESGRVISRKELLEVIVDEFFVLYEEYIKTGNLRFVKETYEKALVNKDREVLILDPAGEYRAVAEGIDEKGELLVRMADGTVREVSMAMSDEKQEKMVLCGANSYDMKYYFNEKFNGIPESVKNELHILCVLFTEEVGGIFTIGFDEEGNVLLETNADDDDIYYDDISSGLMVAEVRRQRRELLESLSIYYRVFILKEDFSDMLTDEDE